MTKPFLPHDERLMMRVDFVESGCWERQGAHIEGYSVMTINKIQHLAHRLAWELAVGPIPEGFDVDHICRNRRCINPDHLEPVTRDENLRRSEEFHGRGRYATHCPKGHEYTPENTIKRYYNGRRDCRTCAYDLTRRWRERQ